MVVRHLHGGAVTQQVALAAAPVRACVGLQAALRAVQRLAAAAMHRDTIWLTCLHCLMLGHACAFAGVMLRAAATCT